jgi:hypothetical protein
MAFGIFVVLSAAAIIQVLLYASLLRRMRSRHTAAWESLGSPAVQFGSSFTWPVVRFLWRKDYRALNDPDFTRRADFCRTYGILYVIALAVGIVWILITAFIGATLPI